MKFFEGRPSMKRKIVVWGDSLLKGIIYDEPSHRYRFLDHSCLELLGQSQKEWSITNFSQYGQTSDRALLKMTEKLAEEHDFDIAIIELGGNDCDFDWKQIANNPLVEHTPKIPLVEFRKNLAAMVKEIRAYGILPVITNLPPINAQRYFKFLSANLNPDQILVWLQDVNNIYRTQEMYSLELNDIARELNVPLINVRTELLSERDYNDCLCSDGIHLNAQGHRRLSDLIIARQYSFK